MRLPPRHPREGNHAGSGSGWSWMAAAVQAAAVVASATLPERACQRYGEGPRRVDLVLTTKQHGDSSADNVAASLQ